MDFIAQLRRRAGKLNRRIAFVEAHDKRVCSALEEIVARQMARPVVVFDSDNHDSRPLRSAFAHELIDTAKDPRTGEIAAHLALAHAGKPGLLDAERSARSPLIFANYLLSRDMVDGVVAGAVHTTADVLRAALAVVGLAGGMQSVSGAFYIVPHAAAGSGQVLTFADCAVIREPTDRQLAEIAIAAARDRRRIVGDEPVVALLSYSTKGSASGPSVELVQRAVELIREADPALVVDGELQGDAALAREVCERKAPGSPVKGNANILVFPSLDAGNIAYKLVQRVGNAVAIGPILQGLSRPCNDLSRGASESDIINVAAITALQGASAHTG